MKIQCHVLYRNNKRLAVVQAIFFNKDAYWFMAIQLI